jgi:peptidoglycan/LPS O-acetylase OafA/YrhL
MFQRQLSAIVWMLLVTIYLVCVVYTLPFAMMWQAILIPFILVGTVLHPSGVPGRVLELRPLRWVGRVSYSLYIWQQLFLVPAGMAHPFRALQSFPLNVLAVFACASLSYYMIERPLIRAGRSVEMRMLERARIIDQADVRQAAG